MEINVNKTEEMQMYGEKEKIRKRKGGHKKRIEEIQ
jgi:hypothetical protein